MTSTIYETTTNFISRNKTNPIEMEIEKQKASTDFRIVGVGKRWEIFANRTDIELKESRSIKKINDRRWAVTDNAKAELEKIYSFSCDW